MSNKYTTGELDLLKQLINDLVDITKKSLRFDKDNDVHRTVVILYGSIFELTSSCCVLIENKHFVGVPILLRSILEAFVDLRNLLQKRDYINNLKVEELTNLIDIGKGSQNRSRPLSTITEAQIAQHEDEKKNLIDRGYKKIKIKEKFKLVGMEEYYRTTYKILCCEAHHDLSSLLNRHLKIEEGNFSIVFFKDVLPEFVKQWIGLAAQILLNSSQSVHSFFNSADLEIVNDYFEKYAHVYFKLRLA